MKSLLWALCIFLYSFQGLTNHNFRLLPHQQKVYDYLQDATEIKGLVLYHALGSGKTVTSLYYAKHQERPITILVPSYLKAQWLQQAKHIGVPANRMRVYSYNKDEDLQKLQNADFSKDLVIIDEVQKLIERVRYSPKPRDLELYWALSRSGKTLLLTGTPIFNDAADIAYIGNLIKGGDVFPFHPNEFKEKYMEVSLGTSLFRGYLTESKLFSIGLPIYGSLLATSLSSIAGTSFAVPAIAMLSSSALNVTNQQLPIQQTNFRQFNASKFASFANRYISFYETDTTQNKDYPSQTIHHRDVHYTTAQVDFYMNFIDGALPDKDLELILQDDPQVYSQDDLRIRSSQIQQSMLQKTDAGREIGNLSLDGPNGFEVSQKFLEVEETIRKQPGQVAVYSSYFHNGLALFSDFLKSKGYKPLLLHSEDSPTQMQQTLDTFNKGEARILLIHPDITEGISLKGVEQFHMLEPVKNLALEKQIIGRSVRYLSHQHLPTERRHVNVYIWRSTVTYENFFIFPTDAGLVRREHWLRRFREVNPNLWSTGIAQLDTKYFEKDDTPDGHVEKAKKNIAKDMESFQDLCRDHSLEQGLQNTAPLSSHRENVTFAQHSRPLISLEWTLFQPSYKIKDAFSNSTRFQIDKRMEAGFVNELPYSRHINAGFGMRFSSGWSTPQNSGALLSDMEDPLADISTLFMSRLHMEPFQETASLFWKGEASLSVFWTSPFYGLSPGFRQSIGLDYRFLSHMSFSAEVGTEGRLFLPTMTTHHHQDELIKSSVMKSYEPFITLGLTSTYF